MANCSSINGIGSAQLKAQIFAIAKRATAAVNRISSNTSRAKFSVKQVVHLTLGFYRPNGNEGLPLFSGMNQSPDYTMERVVEMARHLSAVHDFLGCGYFDIIPDTSKQ